LHVVPVRFDFRRHWKHRPVQSTRCTPYAPLNTAEAHSALAGRARGAGKRNWKTPATDALDAGGVAQGIGSSGQADKAKGPAGSRGLLHRAAQTATQGGHGRARVPPGCRKVGGRWTRKTRT
jgi:hypothetical protein